MTRASTTLALALAAAAVLSSSAGCDKLRALGLGKKDADGGAATSGSATGGTGVAGILPSSFGDAFEGEITMSATGGGRAAPHTMVLGIRRPKFRLDTQGDIAPGNPMMAQGAGIIIDPPQKRAFMLMPAQKTAMVIDFAKAKAMGGMNRGAPGEPPSAAPTVPPTIEKTGTKDVIAGYGCENWKVTSKSSRAEMCVADGIKWIDLTDLGLASPDVALAAVATEANRFPLRVITFNAQNVETSRMQATKIDKKKLDESRFVVPADYKLIDMSAMMGALPGLGGKGTPPGLPPGLPPGFIPPRPPKRR